MNSETMWRRLAVLGVVAAIATVVVWIGIPRTAPEDADIIVYKMRTCECCKNWVAHMRNSGLKVKTVNLSDTAPMQSRLGVPQDLRSCHTAVAGKLWIEGHVPADLVQRLISDNPDNIRGIAVPGMPRGAPGMEGPNPTEYNVLVYDSSGNTTLYARRQGERVAPGHSL